MKWPRPVRSAFTVMETVVAFGVLAVAMTLAAQFGVWTVTERTRSAARFDALEFANNILEAARECSWNELTPDWAAKQQLPEALATRLHEGRLTVHVEPDDSHPHCKRVTVALHWTLDQGVPARPVQLVGLFGARSAAAKEGQP